MFCRFGKQAAGGVTKATEGEGGDTMGEGMLGAETEGMGITVAAVEVAAGMDTGTGEGTTGSLEGVSTPPLALHVYVDTKISAHHRMFHVARSGIELSWAEGYIAGRLRWRLDCGV